MPAALDAAQAQLRAREGHGEVVDAVATARAMALRGRPTAEQLESLGGGWVAEEALAIAVCCALSARDFADGVLLGANHGGDSDSTAAIAGNILGAQLGETAIPEKWLEELELHAEIERIANDLDAISMSRLTADAAFDSYPGW